MSVQNICLSVLACWRLSRGHSQWVCLRVQDDVCDRDALTEDAPLIMRGAGSSDNDMDEIESGVITQVGCISV